HRGDHPGHRERPRARRCAAPRARPRPGRRHRGQPVRPWRQGRRGRRALLRALRRIVSVAPAFEKAKVDGRGVLIGCMPAGFPTVPAGIAAMRAMVESGVDIVEVEFPYSDPVMDGPVIQRASEIALAGGVRTADVLHTIEAAAQAGAPVALMTYWNPIE